MEQNFKTTKCSGLVIKCTEIAKIVTLKKKFVNFVCYTTWIIHLKKLTLFMLQISGDNCTAQSRVMYV